eukprot:CAMPEP_0172567908 /NCGR_PEP_ID=MMETSP1067-20121228/117719_1 /TAXON_ID=265564 ORGANISM="Thalassiosira punctigera, Strain Tpunct2005C2" /NCGR_SAMPLE_ID=MMETSP1067 /ASSEMBLY_ACC=CAM_ASM_000444 /LENGTH=582 /DNA_ID=CAMNT_0013359365 /DNA_START=103 /DNA_END=1851 /DNA_ORIENTATION=+
MAGNDGPFGAILDRMFKPSAASNEAASSVGAEEVVTSFLSAINSRDDPSDIVERYFADEINYVDTSYYNPIEGKEALRKHLYLHAGSSSLSTLTADSSEVVVVDDIVSASSSDEKASVCVMYHMATEGGDDVLDTTAISFYNLRGSKISKVLDVTEPTSPKPGDSGLKLLKSVSKLIGDETILVKRGDEVAGIPSVSVVENYFDAWNRRDMVDATLCFDENCIMRDLQYDDALRGRDEVEQHLLRVKDCLPSTFNFVVDDIAVASNKAGVVWHVENNQDPLAFTRGCSFYTIDERSGLIKSGFEIPEKAPPKLGYWNTLSSKFEAEPIRFIPAAIWMAYMYTLFISDGILPGVNALALEQRTWEEVRDLSLNFFLVAPLLKLPFSPAVHPMLEGVFNLLLSWAAMFAGFLSDERKEKPNLLPFGPMLVGMQFLTSGFLLPYLFTRTPETATEAYQEDIDGALQATVAEWRPLGGLLGGVGTASILWGFIGRPEFGPFSERYASFGDLLSIDRVGSSFIVDLVIFAIFQGWFVDDDLKRRGVVLEGEDADIGGELAILRNVAKYVPFFGLAVYLSFRPSLPGR